MILKSEHILYYADHPVEFVEDIIGAVPDAEQSRILRSVAVNPMTTVRSGHGIGKSAVEAWVVIWFLCTRPYPKIPCTAPTQHQLYDILWAEINKWLRNNPALKKELIWTKEKVYLKGQPEEWFAVARTATTPDALQGFHAENVLYIIDEASGVKDAIFEPVLGALSTEGSRLLMCGNPTQRTGFFYESHNKNKSAYKAFHIDSRNSSRVSQEYVDRIINMYGEDSNVFRVRVAGDFPDVDNDEFIPLHLIEQSMATDCDLNKEAIWTINIGCDVARFGDDNTVITTKVNRKVEIYKKVNGCDLMWTANTLALLFLRLQEKYKFGDRIPIKIDVGGLGGGVVDKLRELKRNEPEKYKNMLVCPINFGKPIKHKYYYDTTTYMMGILRDLLSNQDDNGNPKEPDVILPDNEDLRGQLSTRKYDFTSDGRQKIESKKDLKERYGRSPDEADSVLLVCLPMKQKKNKKEKE